MSSNSTRAVRRAEKKTSTYARAKAEWGARALDQLVRRAACTYRAARMRDRRLGIVRTLLTGRRPQLGTRGRCAPRSYNSSSRARLSDCGGGGRKPVSRRPCRVATVRSTYHTAVVPAILVDEGARASRAPRHPRGTAGPRAHAHDLRGRAYAYWRTHAQTRASSALVASAQNEFWSRPGPSQSLHNRLTVRTVARAGFYNFSLVFASKPSLLFSPLGFRCESKINYISTRLFVGWEIAYY